jgi:hypothetical protein
MAASFVSLVKGEDGRQAMRPERSFPAPKANQSTQAIANVRVSKGSLGFVTSPG